MKQTTSGNPWDAVDAVVTPTPESPIHDSIERHPAYGQIEASRRNGSKRLYGSEFDHHSYIVITIRRSVLARGLSKDRHFTGDELVQVALSEAQWAAFVSSLNIGLGTACTFEFIAGEGHIPQIRSLPDRKRQFQTEMRERLEIASKALKKMRGLLGSAGLSGKKCAELESEIHTAEINIGGNIGFVEEQFGDFIETNIEYAKIEIEAHLAAVIQQAGADALKAGAPPLELKGGSVKEHD